MVYRGPVLPPPAQLVIVKIFFFLAHLIFVDPRNFGPQLSLTKINYQSNKLTVTMTETQKHQQQHITTSRCTSTAILDMRHADNNSSKRATWQATWI